MQERTFVFEGPAGPHTVALLCRQPPEAQEGRSLTWQLDASGGGDASAAAGSGPDLIGLDIWPAAIALCTYLAANPDLVSGHVVCELGAGGAGQGGCMG